jgi:hypothetical protein
MNKLKAIEEAVRRLSNDELAAFRNWFTRFDADAWDCQIESDVAAGKLDKLAAEALSARKRDERREL